MDAQIASKLSSGRWLSTVLVGGTYALVILLLGVAVAFRGGDKDLFRECFIGFATLAGGVIASYFNRSDRGTEPANGSNGTAGQGNGPATPAAAPPPPAPAPDLTKVY